MCLLTYFSPGVLPDTSALCQGSIINNDGHGFAIVHDGQIVVDRGFNAEEMIDRFAEVRAQYPAGPAMFHSRFGTHGSRTLANIHPFTVDNDRRTVVAHNGVLPGSVQPRGKDTRSDTAILAASMGGRFGALRLPRVRAAVEKWMGHYNKLVILTVNPRYRGSAFILNEAAGTWVDGIWYSNDGYKPAHKRWTGYTGGYATGYWSYTEKKWIAYEGTDDGTVLGPTSTEDTEDDRWWEAVCKVCEAWYGDCDCPYEPTAWAINGDLECLVCKHPKRACKCQGSRCTGCFHWLLTVDFDNGVCGVCATCVWCEGPTCDCYTPESAKVSKVDSDTRAIALRAIGAGPHTE